MDFYLTFFSRAIATNIECNLITGALPWLPTLIHNSLINAFVYKCYFISNCSIIRIIVWLALLAVLWLWLFVAGAFNLMVSVLNILIFLFVIHGHDIKLHLRRVLALVTKAVGGLFKKPNETFSFVKFAFNCDILVLY